MAKGVYLGVSGKARKIKKLYIGVGGKARKVKKGYIGISGKARLFFSAESPRYGHNISWVTKDGKRYAYIWRGAADHTEFREEIEGDYVRFPDCALGSALEYIYYSQNKGTGGSVNRGLGIVDPTTWALSQIATMSNAGLNSLGGNIENLYGGNHESVTYYRCDPRTLAKLSTVKVDYLTTHKVDVYGGGKGTVFIGYSGISVMECDERTGVHTGFFNGSGTMTTGADYQPLENRVWMSMYTANSNAASIRGYDYDTHAYLYSTWVVNSSDTSRGYTNGVACVKK